jgi:hypothetical protein
MLPMKNAPYSLAEAEQLTHEYQYLTGQRFRSEGNTTIECVTVAPFDEINKKRFIICYLLFNDPLVALKHDYKGLLFDVLVVAASANRQELEHESLVTWLAKNKARVVNVESETLSSLDS